MLNARHRPNVGIREARLRKRHGRRRRQKLRIIRNFRRYVALKSPLLEAWSIPRSGLILTLLGMTAWYRPSFLTRGESLPRAIPYLVLIRLGVHP